MTQSQRAWRRASGGRIYGVGSITGARSPWKSRQSTLLAVYCTIRCRRFLRSAGGAPDWPAVGARQRRPWIDMCKAAKQQLPIRGRWSTVYLVYGSVRRDLKAIAATFETRPQCDRRWSHGDDTSRLTPGTHSTALRGKGKHAARAGKAPEAPLPDSASTISNPLTVSRCPSVPMNSVNVKKKKAQLITPPSESSSSCSY